MQDARQEWIETLKQYDQLHLFDFWDGLNSVEREQLIGDIRSIDFKLLKSLFLGEEKSVDWGELAQRAEPPKAIRLSDVPSHRAAQQRGEETIRAGKVAMILVAGGQGTRLGFDQPKGMFRIGPVSHRTLFAMHVDSLRGVMKKYGVEIPLFVMTSPATDEETKRYFAAHDRLGLPEHLLQIFCQGTMPAIDQKTGKVLLESKCRVAMSPDGHGGIVAALSKHGILDHCRARGIEHLFYAQVDNPLVTACDPTLIGHHVDSKSQMTTQAVLKRFAKERVGNVVLIDGRTQIIEYSDLPDNVAEKTNSDGSLYLWAGNIAVHVFDRSFLEASCKGHDSLPFHRANKAVPTIDSFGNPIKPTSPNGIKFERFVFDLLPHAERAIVVEGDAQEVFAPVKNADGAATDTPSATRLAISDRSKRWLKSAGVDSAGDVLVEINPMWALDADDVKSRIHSPSTIASNTYFA